jgi:deazaflavin-dependent oxidoreductase (nitroreductase family)
MEPGLASERTTATIPEYRPSSWAILHVVNPLTHLLVGTLGLGNDGVRMLEVKGRNSGVWRSTPVRLLELDEKQYLVALQGETQWVRNLRAQGDGRLRLGHQVTEFRAAELTDSEKLPVLRAYFRQWWSQSASLTTVSSPEAPDEEFKMAAPRHPVFRVDG